MTLLSRLEAKRNDRRRKGRWVSDGKSMRGDAMNEYHLSEIEEDRNRMLRAVEDSSVLDSSGEFHILNFFIRAQSLGARNYNRQDVSLVTQSSVSQLYH